MAKLTLKDITSGFLATQTINDNNALIEALVETFLSRDGLAPNTMLATLDMNSNRIINTLDPLLAQDVATKSYVDAILASGIADQGGNAGLFLTTDGSTTSWADPLPTQVGQAGNFLTTNGTVTSWLGGTFLPDPLVANRLVSNDGATPSWRLDFLLTTNVLAGDNANAGALLNEAASITNPTVVPDKTDLDSGLTLAALDSTGIVSGGVLAVSWAEASGEVLQRSQMTTGITANPVQVQGNTPLFSSFNEISVSANTGDVVTLPAAVVGQIVTVINNGANDVAIFPASGEDLGSGVDTSVALSPGGTLQLLGTAAGTYVQAFNLGLFGDFTDTQFCASNILGPCMQNEASSVTNPTFVPNQSFIETGVGSDATGVAMIYAGDTVATFFSLGAGVNFVGFTAAVTGNPPLISAAGADTDVTLGISSKGIGDVDVTTGNAGTGTNTAGDIVLLTGDGGITSGAGGAIRLTTGGAVGGGTGGSLIINLGDAVGANTGGNFDVTAGDGDSNTDGGFIELDAGIGDGTASGGGFTARGGIGGFSAGKGGQVFIQAGLGGTGGEGGDLDLFGGPGSNAANGGATVLQGGNAGTSSGDGGALTLQGGNVAAGTGNSGAVILRTRASGTAPGNSGTLTIETGSSVSGTVGDILLNVGAVATLRFTASTMVPLGMTAIQRLDDNNSSITIQGGSNTASALMVWHGSAHATQGSDIFSNANQFIFRTADASPIDTFILDTVIGSFDAASAGGPSMRDETATATNPVYVTNKTDLGTGIGGVAGEISFIVVDTEIFAINSTQFRSTNANGPSLQNEASTLTNPTLIPDKTLASSMGIGGTGGALTLISVGIAMVTADSQVGLTIGNSEAEGAGSAGGLLTMLAGDSQDPGGLGGAVTIDGGVGMTTGAGGALTITAGVGGTTGTGGAMTLASGDGGISGAAGGALTIEAGQSSGTFAGGTLTLRGGFQSNINGDSGDVVLETLNAGSTSGISGTLTIATGTAGGTIGDILFNRGGIPQFEIDALGFVAVNASGPAVKNEVSTSTNPVYTTIKSDVTTGVGGVSGEVSLIAGSVEQLTADSTGVGFFGITPTGQSSAYTRNAVVVEDRTLLQSSAATTLNNNNVLAALIADLQAIGILG